MVPAEIKPFIIEKNIRSEGDRMDSVLQLLDELEDVMDSSKAVPFSSKVTVNKEEIYDIISEIRMKLPNELKQSKWVIEERNKILIDAQREADEIVKNAEDRMVRLVDENEVTKKAYEQAAAIIDSAKKTSKDMRLGAMEYAESVLADAEGKLKELKSVVYSESIKTDDYFRADTGCSGGKYSGAAYGQIISLILCGKLHSKAPRGKTGLAKAREKRA